MSPKVCKNCYFKSSTDPEGKKIISIETPSTSEKGNEETCWYFADDLSISLEGGSNLIKYIRDKEKDIYYYPHEDCKVIQ